MEIETIKLAKLTPLAADAEGAEPRLRFAVRLLLGGDPIALVVLESSIPMDERATFMAQGSEIAERCAHMLRALQSLSAEQIQAGFRAAERFRPLLPSTEELLAGL